MTAEPAGGQARGWWTVPNAVTVARLGLIAPISVLIVRHTHPVLAVVLLAVFGTTDWVDGFLARRLGQTSAVGVLLDPIADRVGVVVIVLSFVVAGDLALWVPLLIVGVDLALAGLFVVRRPGPPPGVTPIGKVRTAVLMVGVALLGLGLLPTAIPFTAAGQVLCAIGALLHAAAGVGYLRVLLLARRAG